MCSDTWGQHSNLKPKFSVSVGAFPLLLKGGENGERWTKRGLLGQSATTVFYRLLAISSGKDDDGVELGIIQLVHCVRRHIKESVTAPAMWEGVRLTEMRMIQYKHLPVHDVTDG